MGQSRAAGAAALCILFTALVVPATARLSETEFSRVLAKFRREAKDLSEEHLRQAITQVTDIIQWDSPDSVSKDFSDSMEGQTYDVILYYMPPFVQFDDKNGLTDPGNAMQTRTPANNKLSGITIDVLVALSVESDMQFRYFFPCRKALFDEAGACDDKEVRDRGVALEMLDSVTADGGDPLAFCGPHNACDGSEPLDPPLLGVCLGADGATPTGKCFVGGALKITEELLEKYYVSNSYMEKGFALVTKASPLSPVKF